MSDKINASGADGNKRLFKTGKITTDLIWSIAGLILMNGILQLVVYPELRTAGKEEFGNMQSVYAVVSIMAVTFGSAANYSRMVGRRKGIDSNADCNIFLLGICLLSIPVAAVTLIVYKSFTLVSFILLFILIVTSVLRYYGDVDFRLSMKFRDFFFYYAAITVGYLIGTALFKYVSGSGAMYMVVIAIGEVFALVFVAWRGTIYRKPFLRRSNDFKENERSMLILSATNLIGSVALQSDKLILNAFSGGEAVATYYQASLLGKVVSLLTTPLNGVLISYLTRYEGKITKKIFGAITGVLVAVFVLATLACFVGSYVFIKWKYPEDFDVAKQYFLVANAGQVIYFLSNTLMVVLMRFADEKYQMYINIVYAAAFVLCVIPVTKFFGISGISWAIVAVNTFKFVLIILVGLHRISVNESSDKGASLDAEEKAMVE